MAWNGFISSVFGWSQILNTKNYPDLHHSQGGMGVLNSEDSIRANNNDVPQILPFVILLYLHFINSVTKAHAPTPYLYDGIINIFSLTSPIIIKNPLGRSQS